MLILYSLNDRSIDGRVSGSTARSVYIYQHIGPI